METRPLAEVGLMENYMDLKFLPVRLIVLFLFLFLLFVTEGCGGPQYLPEQLEGHPLNELAELNFIPGPRGGVEKVQIDGESVYNNWKVYLSPGFHTIKYIVWGISDDWKSLEKVMEKKGFTLGDDGKTWQKEDGIGYRLYAKPLGGGPSKVGWNHRSLSLTLQAGEKYQLSSAGLFHLPTLNPSTRSIYQSK